MAKVFENVEILSPSQIGTGFSIAVEEGRVLDVGTREEIKKRLAGRAEFLDYSGFLVTPGLINSHTHCAMTPFRDRAHDQSNMIEDLFFPIESQLKEEWVEALCFPYIYSGLLSGVTCFVDHYYHIDGVAKAMERFGVKAALGEVVADLGSAFPSYENWSATKKKIENWPHKAKPVICPHGMNTVSPKLLRECVEFAEANDLPLHMHLSQTSSEFDFVRKNHGKTPVELAEECGALNENSLLVHLVTATDDDIKKLANAGSTIGFCPSSQILYEKLAPVDKFLAEDIPLALGTDCPASNDSADLLSEMKTAALLIRDRSGFFDYEVILKSVTNHPAKVLGLEELGDIRVGGAADLVFLEGGLENLPQSDLMTNLLFSRGSHQVRHVMIDGEWALKDRQLVQLNIEDLKSEFEKACSECQAVTHGS